MLYLPAFIHFFNDFCTLVQYKVSQARGFKLLTRWYVISTLVINVRNLISTRGDGITNAESRMNTTNIIGSYNDYCDESKMCVLLSIMSLNGMPKGIKWTNPFICANDECKGHQIEGESQILYESKNISYYTCCPPTVVVVAVVAVSSWKSSTVPRLRTTLYLQCTTKVWMGKWQRTNCFVAMAMAIETVAPPEYIHEIEHKIIINLGAYILLWFIHQWCLFPLSTNNDAYSRQQQQQQQWKYYYVHSR